ncbi:glycoside hydrolase family 3 C-terminal domain-containing protein [candidate division KSB1 bacterium]|nr:glycoside hydrolase family 3 C-terminal domain-containing protein [candidate division KSB1 bacterium]
MFLKKIARYSLILGGLVFLNSGYGKSEAIYKDPTQPIDVRVEDLLSRMTLKEKIGQLNMPCVYVGGLGKTVEEKMVGVKAFAEGTHLDFVGPGGGFFTLPNNILFEGPFQQAEFLNELQRIAISKTRLGIPLLQTEEGTHGLMCTGGTIYPEGPALGSTWNLDLLSRIYAATAKEARAIGIHQIFTLVVEPIRDPRLGRNQEAYSEDAFQCARIAKTIVRAVQGDDISASDKTVAGLCHYPGQSEPVSGLERGAMEISERKLREVFLPPWEAGIKSAGALGVMATYPAVDGVPTHASHKLLTGILREEFGFEGLVLSEGGGIETLVYEGLAPTQKEAGQLALAAGLDVGISYESGFMADMVESIEEGKASITDIDRSVRRVLKQKFRLGLFENPYVDPKQAVKIVHNQAYQELALVAAREGVVLLRNEGDLLPLNKDLKSIAVIGPNADHAKNQLGDYTALQVSQEITTILKGIRTIVSPETDVQYVKGCDVVGSRTQEIDKAVQTAKEADAAVVVVGENEWQQHDEDGNRIANSGEGFDVANLDLSGMQTELVKAVVATGTPTIVILVNGRPLSTRWISENVPAIIESWIPGEKGGQAIAEILFGDVNPSGKLTVTIPRHSGQLPVYYNAKRSKRHWLEHGWGNSYADMDYRPLYPFGHGLSYTTFKYSNLRFDQSEIGVAGSIQVSVDVRNTGDRAGKEVVQLYIQDVIATVSVPEIELRGFQKIHLNPGEKKTVTFEIGPEHLELYNQHLERIVEPGEFKIKIAASSADIRLEDSVWVK